MQDPAVPSSVPVEADRTVDGSLGDDVKRGGMVQFDLCVLLEVSELLFFCLNRYYFVFLGSPKPLQVVAAAVALCYRVRNPEFLRHVLLIWLHSETYQQSSVSTVAKSGNLAGPRLTLSLKTKMFGHAFTGSGP